MHTFLRVVQDFNSFGEAMVNKLVTEIADAGKPDGRPVRLTNNKFESAREHPEVVRQALGAFTLHQKQK